MNPPLSGIFFTGRSAALKDEAMFDQNGFDRWAEEYDEDVIRTDEAEAYPFAGYRKILHAIAERILESGAGEVLELGFGTGTLAKRLYDRGIRIFGQDFSEKMIAAAREKMPEAALYLGDLRAGLSEELRARRYDAIVATYVLHHIPDEEKPAFLLGLMPLLRSGGTLYIGDVAFETKEELERCREESGDEWDDEEAYFVEEETKAYLPALHYEFFSRCGGLMTLRNPVFMTERLMMRRWEESDAEDLFPLASDPAVGPIAGWPPHESVEESRNIIRSVLSGAETYAILRREDGCLIGSVGLHLKGHTDLTERADECELGYWIGKPFWGHGYMTEAAREMLRHAFMDLRMRTVWCGYYDGNERSRRVQEKCGFHYQWTSDDVDVPQMNETRRGHVNRLTKTEWLTEEALRRAALAAEKPEETRIRPMMIEDYDQAYALWLSTKGMGLNDRDDSREGIRQYLLRNPSTSFVAEEGAEIVGTILAGHDGRRGCIYHLAVREDHRRQGIASRLLEQALTALRAEGIRKVFLVAFRNNEDGNAFWESRGFALREDLSYRDKVLMEMLRIDT